MPIKAPSNKPNNNRWHYAIVLLLAISAIAFFAPQYQKKSYQAWKDVDKFFVWLQQGKIKKVSMKVNKNMVYFALTEEARKEQHLTVQQDYDYQMTTNTQLFYLRYQKIQKQNDLIAQQDSSTSSYHGFFAPKKGVHVHIPHIEIIEPTYLEQGLSSLFANLFSILTTLLLLLALFFFRHELGFGTSKRNVWGKKNKKTGITLKDVQGMAEAKKQLRSIIDYFKHPEKYQQLGAEPPKGAVLVGPPGTGKTLLAKAIAGESDVPLISVSGSEFEEVYVGLGAKRVRQLFEFARKIAPCIIFIDEVDTLGRKRSSSAHGHDTNEHTLNQLLSETDGFTTNDKIFLLASTNRPQLLDSALTRPGRLGLKVFTSYPTKKERKDTFEYYLNKMKVASTVSATKLAEQTPGFSYADIAETCNIAGLVAANNSKDTIDTSDCNEALDQQIAGLKREERIMSASEKEIVAHHEIGHAFVAHCCPKADPLIRISIMPRTDSTLGFAQYLPEEKVLHQLSYMLDEICTLLGGRAAEEVFFGEISTGAQNDLERVTKMAYAIIVIYGMNKEVGTLSYYDSQNTAGYTFAEPYSQETKNKIDQEVRKLVEAQYQRALGIIKQHKDIMKKATKVLIEKEEISSEEFVNIVGPRSKYLLKTPAKKLPPKAAKPQPAKKAKPPKPSS